MQLEPDLSKDGLMMQARFTQEQVIAALKEHEAGAKTADPPAKALSEKYRYKKLKLDNIVFSLNLCRISMETN